MHSFVLPGRGEVLESGMQLPQPQCPICPRLVAFREDNRLKYPSFYNGAVPPFGGLDAPILIVGLAPGLKGANATGRPFTGDYAGDILYAALKENGLAEGHFQKRADDGFTLKGVRITNAVRCVPPENKPEPMEIKECNRFLASEIASMPNLKVILSLGNISHAAVLRASGKKLSQYRFGHGAEHIIENERSFIILDSYHTSRYNIQTRRLTPAMFDVIVKRLKQLAAL